MKGVGPVSKTATTPAEERRIHREDGRTGEI